MISTTRSPQVQHWAFIRRQNGCSFDSSGTELPRLFGIGGERPSKQEKVQNKFEGNRPIICNQQRPVPYNFVLCLFLAGPISHGFPRICSGRTTYTPYPAK